MRVIEHACAYACVCSCICAKSSIPYLVSCVALFKCRVARNSLGLVMVVVVVVRVSVSARVKVCARFRVRVAVRVRDKVRTYGEAINIKCGA